MIKHTLEHEWYDITVEEIQYDDPSCGEALSLTVPYVKHTDREGKLFDAYDASFDIDFEEVEFLHRVFGEWLQHQRSKE